MRSGAHGGPNVPTSSVAKRSHSTPAELSTRRDCFANRRNGSVLLPVRSQSSSHAMWTEITQFIFGQPLPTVEILQFLERVSFTPASRPIRQLERSSLPTADSCTAANAGSRIET